MPYWNFEYTKAVISTGNVGGGIGQDPANEVAHVGLNQPPVFSSDTSISPCRFWKVVRYSTFAYDLYSPASVILSWLVNIVCGGRGHVILTQLHSKFSIGCNAQSITGSWTTELKQGFRAAYRNRSVEARVVHRYGEIMLDTAYFQQLCSNMYCNKFVWWAHVNEDKMKIIIQCTSCNKYLGKKGC